jgi:hypothetical protein
VYSPHKFDARRGSRALPLAAIRRAVLRVLPGVALVLCVSAARGQDAPPGTIGRVSGYDVSVDGGNSAPLDTATNAPSIYVSNGSVVTVHSGNAHMALVSGGQVDICGPAKFTLLVSGASITMALNFGRVHVLLPAATQLRIFTPTIVATPIDISGNQRDITAGLDLNDSLCVRATSGALQLEQQFTGEDLIVPQSGEFFLANGKLVPVAGTPGSCDCAPMAVRAQAAPPAQIPLMGITGRIAPAPSAPEVAANNETTAPAANIPVPQQNVQLRALQLNNDAHPVAPPAKAVQAPPPAPLTSVPEYMIIAPPLSFSANEPQAPAESANEVALLVRTVHVEPEWQFSGRVQPPSANPQPVAAAAASAAPVATSPSRTPSNGVAGAGVPQKKEGFWSKMKRAFGGS